MAVAAEASSRAAKTMNDAWHRATVPRDSAWGDRDSMLLDESSQATSLYSASGSAALASAEARRSEEEVAAVQAAGKAAGRLSVARRSYDHPDLHA